MKKAILVFGLFILTLSAFCQNTTREEYAYMTKGIKVQMESGLDMKKGYVLKKVLRVYPQGGNSKITFTLLLRENRKDNLAGVVVFTEDYTPNKWTLKSIPISDSNITDGESYNEIMSAYTLSLREWNKEMLIGYIEALGELNVLLLQTFGRNINQIPTIE